jgi:hypothetical protein
VFLRLKHLSIKMHDTAAICQTHPRLKLGVYLVAAFGALAVSLPSQAEDKSGAEAFQHNVCDVAAIFSRLSGRATNGTQHISPTDGSYRTFALDMARRNGFEDPRAIGGAMNGRAAFVYFYDSSRMGPYTFAMFVADYHNWFGIVYGGRFCHLIDDELTLPVVRRGPR